MQSQASRLGAPLLMVLLATGVSPRFVSAETRVVLRGHSLQAALNAAAPGDVILLEPGAEFVGNFVLPVKTGDTPIVVRSAQSASLPAETIRIQPQHAPLLAKIRSSNAAAALRTAAGAHHWELRHLEFRANLNGYGDIIQLGDGSSNQDTLTEVPHHIVLSHAYVHGHELLGQKRCIALNAAHVTIRDSHVSECKAVGVDTQAIGGWNGPGPYLIENNYLEATGENVLFGGADPAIANLVADGVTFRRNHVSRPMAWRDPIIAAPQALSASAESGGVLTAGTYAYRVIARRSVGQGTIGRSSVSAEVSATVAADGGAVRLTWQAVANASEYRVYGRTAGSQAVYWTVTTTSFVDTGSAGASGAVPLSAGTVWSVKNLFELKSARNVVVEDNIFENHWKESQPGYAIVLTPRNSGGACTWCVVEHVRFEHNVIRRVAAGFNILGYDSPTRPTKQTNDIVIRNNVIYDMGEAYGGNGWFLLVGDQPRDIVIDHNTIANSGNAVTFVYGGSKAAPKQITGMRFTNNAARHSTYGINGEFFSYGNGIIQGFFPDGTVTGNYLAGGSTTRYPSGNRTSGVFEQEYEGAATGDFRLRPTSQLRRAATDGGDIGADFPTLEARIFNVVEGIPTTGVVRAPSGLRIVTGQ
jgi:hypothetical protein